MHRGLRREPPVQPAVRRDRDERGRLRRRDRRVGMGADTAFPALARGANARGRPGHAPDARAVGLRRRRRDHRRRRRSRRPSGTRAAPRTWSTASSRASPLDGFVEPLAVVDKPDVLARQRSHSRREPLAAAGPLRAPRRWTSPRSRPPTHRGRGARGRRPLPRLRRLLRVPRVHLRLPRGRDRPRHARAGGRARRRRRDRLDRLHALPRRREAAVRLRQVPERHHRHADGAPARADAPVQHGAAPERRQGAGADRLRHVHRLARRDRRQPAVLEVLLHVLDQAEPADHGRAAARRRDRPLHRHPRRRQGLRRVLRAGQGDGRELRQGPRRLDRRDGRGRPHAPLRGHRQRRRRRRGRVRPRRARRRRPAEPRRRSASSRSRSSRSTTTTTSTRSTRT